MMSHAAGGNRSRRRPILGLLLVVCGCVGLTNGATAQQEEASGRLAAELPSADLAAVAGASDPGRANVDAATASVGFSTRIDAVLAEGYRGPEVLLASDHEFHRRIYLDLLGRGPTVQETEAFLEKVRAGDKSAESLRNDLIDDLLEREEFSRYYAKVLDVMFTERRELISVQEFRGWIRQWLEQRRPLNEMCTEILAADGTGSEHRAAAAFILNRQADPNLVTRDIGRIFFGRDMQCAQCHDHPLVPGYAQADYYGLLSFVHRTYLFEDEKRGKKPFLGEKSDGELQFASVFEPEAGKRTAEPVLPMAMAMDSEPDFVTPTDAYIVPPDKDNRGVPRYSRRQQLAVLATHAENDSFNRNLANRLWAQMMGMGVVHPVDMHHAANPPASAALLRLLADELVACQYDLRAFLRQVARSKAYQRSVAMPDLASWPGPAGGMPALDRELEFWDAKAAELKPQVERGAAELSEAASRVRKYQEDVSRLQSQCEEAKKQLQELIGQRDKDAAQLAERKERLAKVQQLVNALQAAANESDKILQLTPDDQELAAARALLAARMTKATADKTTLEGEIEEQQEAVEDGGYRVEDQRSRILSLTNRRMALGEFVTEARGVQRRLIRQFQALSDAEGDCGQQKTRIRILKEWLSLKAELEQARGGGDEAALAELQRKLELKQTELVESLYRSYALRRVRGLTPEQMTGATYAALELHQPVAAKALADWESKHQGNSAEAADPAKRQAFVNAQVAEDMWNTVEDLVVARFSSPAGAPQDGFFATVDQALMIQNDPAYQSWFKAAEGTLIHRLNAIEDPATLASQLYLAVLGRTPDADEARMVQEMLSGDAAERGSIVQELVWGVLASTEFRFSM